MAIKITAQQENIEQLIKDIAIPGFEIEGKGYVNEKAGIVGIMIYAKNDASKMIDIFIDEDDPTGPRLGIQINDETDKKE